MEYTLRFESGRGERAARVSSRGASLRSYGGAVWGYSGDENKRGGQGDVLIPFPGRVARGEYSFAGKRYELARNDKEGPNAIHGFLRTVEWEVAARDESSILFVRSISASEFQGYPFELRVELKYRLGGHGLACFARITNSGRHPAPVGMGFHPYFKVGEGLVDDWELEVPARKLIEFGPNLLPTGRALTIEPSLVDFRRARRIGDARINHCVSELERDSRGIARVRLRNPLSGESVTVWMDRAFDYVVLYTGDAIPGGVARRSLAIEPMSCATDAFNRPEWGLQVLGPAEVLFGSWGVGDPELDMGPGWA